MRRKAHVARGVDRRHGDGLAIGEMKDREAALGRRAAEDELIPALGRARHLQVHLVLVGPEPRHLGEGDFAARDHLGDGDRLVLRVLPRFEADVAADQRIEMPRHVARGKDGGSLERPNSSTLTPSSMTRPASAASSVLGCAPMPTAT